MPPIMANSNKGQDHKDKYFDTSRKILSQEMTMYNMEAFSILSLRNYDQCQFFFLNLSNVKVKRFSTYKKISLQGIFMWNIKVLAPTIQKLLARLKIFKNRSHSQVKVTRSKIMVPTNRSYHKKYSCEIPKL